MRLTILAFTLLLATTSVISQKREVKFGKVSDEELKMTECSFAPDANSMTLYSFGELRFNYVNDKGFQLKIRIHERIKVFNTLDKDIANVSLVYYDPVNGYNRESISGIRAFTYNLENGKMVKTKLTNSEEYTTRLSDYRSEVSFAVPDVRDGSVFEYEYEITSDFISNLYQWEFQKEHPVAVSEFRYTIPEYFNYNSSQMGTYVQLERAEESRMESFTYRWQSTMGSGGQMEKGTSTLSSNSKFYRFVGRNIPAIEEEPYMSNRPDIPARLEFQLISIKMPGQSMQLKAEDYAQFNNTLMDWSTLGETLKKGNFAKEKIATLNGTPEEKAQELYVWLRDHFAFNDVYSYTSSSVGKSAFNEGTGSVGDINLTLVAALREAELNAFPVILSTRGHGMPHPVYPNTEDFNYVVAAVETSNGLALMDATTNLPFGVLPTRCLNANGWLLSESGGQWVKLKNNADHSTTTMAEYTFTDDEMTVDYSVKYQGYAAITEANKAKSDQSKYEENLMAKFPEYEISEAEVSHENGDMKVNFTTSSELNGDIIYIQPMQFGAELENPFKREERMSLVDFPYSISESVIVKINVPEGYTAELPEPINMALPNNGGRFLYSASTLGNQINIMTRFQLNQTEFSTIEYGALKQFFELATNKNKEMVVLKKQ